MNISVRQVLGNAFSLFKANFLQIMICSFIPIIPSLFLIFSPVIKKIMMDANIMGGNIILGIGGVVVLCLCAVLYIGYAYNLIKVYDGQPLHWRNILPEGFARIVHVIWFYLCSVFFYVIGLLGASLASGVIAGGVLFLTKDMPLVSKIIQGVLAVSCVVLMILYLYTVLRLAYGFFDAIENPQHSIKESYVRSWNMSKGYIGKRIMYAMSLFFLIIVVAVPFGIIFNVFVTIPTPSELMKTSELLKNHNSYILASYFIGNILFLFWLGMYDALKKVYLRK